MSVRSVIWLAALAVLASGCVAPPPPMPGETTYGLYGTAWVLESASNAPVQPAAAPAPAAGTTQPATVTAAPAPAPLSAAWLLPARGNRPTLTFSGDRSSVTGATGCNKYFGSYFAGGNSLTFQNLATTKMMCFDALAVQEIQYLDMLAKVTGYTNDGQTLTLSTNDGRRLTYSPLAVATGTQAARYNYVCEDGLYFNATYDPATQSAAIQVSTGETDTLQHDPAGRRGLYVSARHSLQANGNEALLGTADGLSHRCVAPLQPQG